jgi:2',3'-cyclic-nucleotide 2'-phosphodiesterase (5'-nucleotidase family)
MFRRSPFSFYSRADRRASTALVLFCLALLACSGLRCSGETTKPAAPKPRPDLRLLLLTDPKGYLEPCGCQQRPLGGVDKLATLVAKARRDGVPTLLLAAGDLAFGMELSPEDAASAATQEAWRAETLVQIWGQIGLQAAAPGKLDLLQPPALLTPLITKGGFPWLIDNLTSEASAAALGSARSRVVDASGVKVGVLGLVAPDPTLRLPEGAQLEPALPDVAARSAQSLREQGAKLVVVLLSGDRRTARSLAGHGVDVVVMGGVDLEQPLPPAVHEGTLLVHAGRQGQRLVQLELELDAQGELHDVGGWARREAQRDLREKASELRARIASWEQAKNVADKDLAVQRERLAEMERELADSPAPKYEGRWFSAEVSELSPEVPSDPKIAALVDAYDQRVNEHNRTSLADRVPAPTAEGSPHFVGSEACQSCHEPAYTWWLKTKHGRAYATLQNVHKEFNLSCVGCHVTGYNQPGGSTVTHVEKLRDVGCENCHGAGSAHAASPKELKLPRDTPEKVCASCHTHEHSDRFVYEAFKTLLTAPGHGLPVAKGP